MFLEQSRFRVGAVFCLVNQIARNVLCISLVYTNLRNSKIAPVYSLLRSKSFTVGIEKGSWFQIFAQILEKSLHFVTSLLQLTRRPYFQIIILNNNQVTNN